MTFTEVFVMAHFSELTNYELDVLKKGHFADETHLTANTHNSFVSELLDKIPQLCDLNHDLQYVAEELYEDFEEKRRHYGKGHAVFKALIELSKDGVRALRRGDTRLFLDLTLQSREVWDNLGALNMRPRHKEMFDGDAGQEMTEFFFAGYFYSILINDTRYACVDRDVLIQLVQLPQRARKKFYGTDKEGGEDRYQELCFHVAPQAWLHGIGDTVGELGKMMYGYLATLAVSDETYIETMMSVHKNFIGILEFLYGILEKFETAYGLVLNNSDRRGFGNTFRGILFRIERIAEEERRRFVEDRVREASHRVHEARIADIIKANAA